MTPLYIIGAILTLLSWIALRLCEKTWAPPAALFVAAFSSANYLYPYTLTRLSTDLHRNLGLHNIELATQLALLCHVAVLVGYVLYFACRGKSSVGGAPKAYFIKPKALPVVIGLVAIYLVVTIMNHPLFTSSDHVRGENSYVSDIEVGWSYRIRFVVAHTLNPLICAIMVASLAYVGRERRISRMAVAFAAIVVVICTMASFDRQMAIGLVIMLSILYHFRVRRFRFRMFAYVYGVAIVLELFRYLRSLNLPYSELTLDEAVKVMRDIDVVAVLTGPFTAIGGWTVYAHVIDLVPGAADFRYGMTYWNSFVGLLAPRALGLGSYQEMTPSRWFMETYAPGTTNHGFDFAMLGEAYLNFGAFMPIMFIIIGMYVAWLSTSICRTPSPMRLFFAVVGIQVITFAFRTDSNVVFKATFYQTIPLIVLVLLLNKFVPDGPSLARPAFVPKGTNATQPPRNAANRLRVRARFGPPTV